MAVRRAAGTRTIAAEPAAHFTPKAYTFLRGLARNNRKEWFEAHRDEYARELRAPLVALVEEMDVRLATIAPEIVGTPKRSIFRIHRDVRFSKDKKPYKTHAACWFYHRDAGHQVGDGAVHGGAGFYFHFSPDEAFCGGGVWMPPRPALAKVREALDEDHETFAALVKAPTFKRRFGALDTEAVLTRMPRGFAETHPAAAWLKYQSFTAGQALTPAQVTSAKLPETLAKAYAALVPWVRWLNRAMGFREASGR
ncbi:MAG: DUF2461 domain-containing protein [Gemmatimonadaceae bacterium]|jgi:uncharacterized protein (TIGR02453 family)|nr:DUF2461 domain-containing protein [Gemmatimonadaceae bacterium]